MRPVHVVGANSDQRQLETTSIGADHHFGCSLTRRVGVRGCQYAGLAEVCRTNRYIAIHLVR